jgi:hypothetical protein
MIAGLKVTDIDLFQYCFVLIYLLLPSGPLV